MKLAVEFPSVSYREGPEGVARLARGIEAIGYDQIDLFDHVVMGHPREGRPAGPYSSKMPLLEPLTTLSYIAGVTERVGLGTEVLVLPQRQPVLVAKQVSTLDTLSGGRVRLGVGTGWQRSEYEALGVPFAQRGARMDEAIQLLRACWIEDSIDFAGPTQRLEGMAMEPRSPQGSIPIWIGGHAPRALRRAGELGDGWLAGAATTDLAGAKRSIATIRQHAEAVGRDPAALGFQAQISPPPRPGDDAGRDFYANADLVASTAELLSEAGFGWATLNATSVFLAGARSMDALVDALAKLHDRLRSAVG